MHTMHVGIDDTDSTMKGCTTYIAAMLAEKLEQLNVQFMDYPNLIRLNPNVPWKTRGNGALCLRFKHEQKHTNTIKKAVIELVESCSEINSKGTDPGIVFLDKTKVPEEITRFSKSATTGVVTLNEATRLITKYGCEGLGYNTCRGIIGALAAIGWTLQEDHTYEVIAYRKPENIGTKREIEKDSILEMEKQTRPYTFNNVDFEKKRILITPRGPDPILFGIRGETPEIVKRALQIVRPLEQIERWVIFRSNQGTDAHLNRVETLRLVKPFTSVVVKGEISRKPVQIPVRHIVFSIKDDTAEVDCAAYEPTGELRKVAEKLMIGDNVEVYGAVRQRSKNELLTINLEKIRVLSLVPNWQFQNPNCPVCGKHLESMGLGKGFRCKKCGQRFRNAQKRRIIVERDLKEGLYLTSTRSERHLTKPLRRYGQEKHFVKTSGLVENWHN